MANNKQPIRFRTAVEPGQSKRLTHKVKADATIEEMNVRFYRGPELALHVTPKVIDDQGDGQPEPLVDVIGADYIDGDADHFNYPLAEPVRKNDVIEVHVENVAEPDPDDNVTLTFDTIVEMDLDREGGMARPFETIRNALGGLF